MNRKVYGIDVNTSLRVIIEYKKLFNRSFEQDLNNSETALTGLFNLIRAGHYVYCLINNGVKKSMDELNDLFNNIPGTQLTAENQEISEFIEAVTGQKVQKVKQDEFKAGLGRKKQ